MTSNPHPEHGPLWVERNSRRYGILARPHALMGGDDLVGSLYPHQADAIEPQITPLHELCGRKLPGCDWVIRGVNVDKAGVTVRDHQLLSESRNLWTVDLNPDGTVTVQGQAVESC